MYYKQCNEYNSIGWDIQEIYLVQLNFFFLRVDRVEYIRVYTLIYFPFEGW